MPNLEDESMDIKTDLEDFLNISQQRKNALKVKDNTVFQLDYNNPPVGQEEYKNGRGIKRSKAWKGRWNGKMEQVRRDCMSEVKVHHVFQ